MAAHKSIFLRFIFFSFSAIFILSGCSLMSRKEDAFTISKNPCIVLALPASGPYSSISGKIRKGAEIASKNLLASDIHVRLENINTENPAWIAELEKLPEECAVVGGPLQEKTYQQAQKSNVLERRVFFSFMPALKATEEGNRAWRFFPSPQDQIDALVKFVTENLHISTFGAFFPADQYGSKMASLLEKTLAQQQIPLQKTSYNPKQPATWTKSAAILVKPAYANRKNPIPNTSFEAVFLPDSWKNIDNLTSSFLNNGEDRLVLLGTNLWEQGVYGKHIPNAQNYALAIFPGAWNKSSSPKILQGKENDFWSALGFDFVNFAVNLGVQKRLVSPQITAAAQRASTATRAIAPLSYDNNGIAHEKLFIFQISSNGLKPVNIEELRNRRKQAQENTALRIQKLNEEPEENYYPSVPSVSDSSPEIGASSAIPEGRTEAVESAPQTFSPMMRPVTPQTTSSPVLGTTPQPSYKLRLPTKK